MTRGLAKISRDELEAKNREPVALREAGKAEGDDSRATRDSRGKKKLAVESQ